MTEGDGAHRYLAVLAVHRRALRVLFRALDFTETIYTANGTGLFHTKTPIADMPCRKEGSRIPV